MPKRLTTMASSASEKMAVSKAQLFCYILILGLAGSTYCQTEVEPQASSPAEPPSTETAWEAPGEEGAAGSVRRALRYLLAQRHADWGWANDTSHVILALQLANNTFEPDQPASLEMQLSTKQMEIEILLMLSKHHESGPPLARLASFALSLGALCRSARAFHGRDLAGALLHREPARDRELAYAALAACSAAAHVRKRHIRRLLDIANAAADHNLDTIAMVILALRCIVHDHRHRNLLHFVRRPMAGLARQQQPDGGFGGVTTTALAIQALSENDMGGAGAQQHWNRTAAVGWLVRAQAPDGSWGDVRQTAAAAVALAPRGLGAVRAMECGDRLADLRHDAQESFGADYHTRLQPGGLRAVNDSDGRNVSFTYTLWLGTNVTDNYTLYMIAPRNISFYHVMQMAAEQDPKFEFSASEWPNGHYVHTLAGHKEEPMGYHYWLLYRLPEIPDPAAPPGNQLVAPVGVDDLTVEEGEHYLFWYKKL